MDREGLDRLCREEKDLVIGSVLGKPLSEYEQAEDRQYHESLTGYREIKWY
jgi:hypothetical protein